MTRSLKALVAACAASLAAAAPAAADSIVFTKDRNVWIAKPDGTGLHQVTNDGTETRPYRSPAQADDGTIVAGHGYEIVRLRHNGQVLSRFDPPAATTSTGATIKEVPQDIAVSPDGSRIAFVYHNASCPPGAPCGARQVLLYSHADRATPVSEFGQHTNRRNPSWVDNGRILLFGGAGAHVNLDSPGGTGDDAQHWFDDHAMEDLDDGELSRQGDRLALIRGYGSNTHLAIFSVGQVGGAPPEGACATGTEATLASPTWSPDGKALAFAHSQGIEVLPLPNVVPGDCPGAGSGRVVIPGGAEPDWGPADIKLDGPPPPPPCTPPSNCRPPQALALKLAKRVNLRAALKKGVTVTVTVPEPGKLAARGKAGGRKVASGSATAKAAGKTKVRLRFSRKAARKLARKRSVRLALTVTYRPSSGGSALTGTGSLQLRR